MKHSLTVFWCAAASLGLTLGTIHAQDAAPPAPAPTAAGDATAAAPAPTPTLEQRVAAMETYFSNSDPTGPLKDPKGNIPTGLTTVAGSNPAPATMSKTTNEVQQQGHRQLLWSWPSSTDTWP